ncbi:MAG: HlyD family secretion protein [Muribaculaceae bacterium]|nr:HlyD family secretion protein [Muribaculaceae bacterium]
MDKEIPKEEIAKRKRLNLIKIGAGVCVVIALAWLGGRYLFSESLNENDLVIKPVERGTLESSVTASGKVVPLYEQAIVSPVATRVMEVYCTEGDSVEAGQSLLCLDLQSAESDLRRLGDEVSMKQNEIEQAALNN